MKSIGKLVKLTHKYIRTRYFQDSECGTIGIDTPAGMIKSCWVWIEYKTQFKKFNFLN